VELESPLRKFKRPPLPLPAMAEFVKAREWLQPIKNPEALIGFEGWPLYIEVGCGVGLHPIRWSQQNLHARLLAFERTTEKYTKAAHRFINNSSPQNIHIVHGDASILLPYLIEPQSIDGFFFLYPNPYPKPSQANLRLPNSPFLHFIRQSLKPGGTLTLATNSVQYASEAIERLPANGLLLMQNKQIESHAIPRTHFEKKYLMRGEICYDLVFRVQS
jgi:tRNA (guanine-N7-)-methyltransferase